MVPPEERRHLNAGPRPGERRSGAGLVDVVAVGSANAGEVLDRVRAVIEVVIDHQLGDWPDIEQWRSLLPGWFVDACADQMTRDQADAWLAWWQTLPADQQAAASDEVGWSLPDWLSWLEPDERQWFWWDARIEMPDRLRVTVEIPGWPAPLGALEWLLQAAGAVTLVVEEPVSV